MVIESFEIMRSDTKIQIERFIPAFQRAWSVHDPEGVGSIPIEMVGKLMEVLPGPIGAVGIPRRRDHREYKLVQFKTAFVLDNLSDFVSGHASFNAVLFLLFVLHCIDVDELRGHRYNTSVVA